MSMISSVGPTRHSSFLKNEGIFLRSSLESHKFPFNTESVKRMFDMSALVMCKYQKINSGSMRGSAKLWKPVSTQLIDEMIQKLVQIERYYLFSYVNTISSILNTVDPTLLRSTMENWNTYSGSQELTYAGKMRAFCSLQWYIVTNKLSSSRGSI